MSEAQHTPGPWRASNAALDGFKPVMAPGGAIICLISTLDRKQVANARLIAAAPDLLAALIEAREALHFHFTEWDGEPEDAVPLQLARAKCDSAIAKAKGGEA